MKRLIFAAVVLVTATVTVAGPLRPKSIPANATWFLHLDAEAVKSSTFGKCMLARLEKEKANNFEEMQSKLGIDLKEDVYSLTVFGLGATPKKGLNVRLSDDKLEIGGLANPADSLVVIAEVSADAAKSLIEHLSEVKEAYRQISVGDYKVHAMIEPVDDDDEGETKLLVYVKPGDSTKRRTLIVSDEKHLLLAAIKTLAGDAPNLTGKDSLVLSLKHRDGSLLVMSASDIHELTGGNGGSAILKGSEAFSFEISEVDGVVNFNVAVTTESAETAKNIMVMAQGALAFAAHMSMQSDNEDEDLAALLTLAQSLNFKADDKQLSVSFEHSAKELCELVEAKMSGRSHDDEDED